MVNVKTYQVGTPRAYVETTGIVEDDVMVVDRNGIGVKHGQFLTGTDIYEVVEYQWYGVKPIVRPPGSYLIELSEVLTSTDRTYVFRVGPVPAVGNVFTLYYGSIIAKYTAQAGDTATNVRDGLQSAVNAQSWGVTVTTNAIGINQLEVVVDDITTTLTNMVGFEKWKNGYYVVISGIYYIVLEQESTTSQPALPGIAASYNYSALNDIPSTITVYLNEPMFVKTYDEPNAQNANINAVPQIGNVPFNQCVVYELQQRIYFNLPLLAGELINVISK